MSVMLSDVGHGLLAEVSPVDSVEELVGLVIGHFVMLLSRICLRYLQVLNAPDSGMEVWVGSGL